MEFSFYLLTDKKWENAASSNCRKQQLGNFFNELIEFFSNEGTGAGCIVLFNGKPY